MHVVAFLHSAPPARIVGGEAMTLDLLAYTAATGPEGTVVAAVVDTLPPPPSAPSPVPARPGVLPAYVPLHPRLRGVPLIAASHPDAPRTAAKATVLVTHPEIAHLPYARLGLDPRTPRVLIVHNTNPATFTALVAPLPQTLAAPTHVLFNSAHTRDAFFAHPHAPSPDAAPFSFSVAYPPTHAPTPPPTPTPLPPTYATQVNVSAAKGGHLLPLIADLLPDVPFLAVSGGYGDQLLPVAAANITSLGHGPLHLPLALTRVLLSPSRDETYGMAVAEALQAPRPIPVLISDLPAHREAFSGADTAVRFLPTPPPAALPGTSGYRVLQTIAEIWAGALQDISERSAWETAQRDAVQFSRTVLQPRTAATYREWDRVLDNLSR